MKISGKPGSDGIFPDNPLGSGDWEGGEEEEEGGERNSTGHSSREDDRDSITISIKYQIREVNTTGSCIGRHSAM